MLLENKQVPKTSHPSRLPASPALNTTAQTRKHILKWPCCVVFEINDVCQNLYYSVHSPRAASSAGDSPPTTVGASLWVRTGVATLVYSCYFTTCLPLTRLIPNVLPASRSPSLPFSVVVPILHLLKGEVSKRSFTLAFACWKARGFLLSPLIVLDTEWASSFSLGWGRGVGAVRGSPAFNFQHFLRLGQWQGGTGCCSHSSGIHNQVKCPA